MSPISVSQRPPANFSSAQDSLSPPGWPVAEPGLLMTYISGMLTIRMDGTIGDGAFQRYKAEWLRAVDARPENAKVFAFYHWPDWPGFTATQRKEWAELLKSRHLVLKRTTIGNAIATSSMLARGTVRAIFWMAPPPFPYTVVDTPAAAFRFFEGILPTFDARLNLERYRHFVERYGRRL